ncbi:MAG: hypothetical protein IT330_17130 [Anaerolineae bacterium]|nr:hypothetical protein [Anaerolineae bacterium]
MSRQPTVLTIDLGLTNCKASLFSLEGRLVGQASHRYPTLSPQRGWSEQDPQEWWRALKACSQALQSQPGTQKTEIIAISATGHMHGLVALDREGHPLTTCWTLFDQRAEAEAQELNRLLSAETTYRLTGARLEAYTPAAKIAWLKQHRPDVAGKAAFFLAPKDVIRCQLGGEPVTDPIDAAGTVLYDLRRGAWADELVTAAGIRREQLPEVRPSWAHGGRLGEEAAQELGLRAGIPLIVGGGDDVEALGAGVVTPGQALEHIGTTGTLIACLSAPRFDPERRLEVYPHPAPNLYLLGGSTNAAGYSLDWARRFVSHEPTAQAMLPLTYPPSGDAPRPPLYLPFIKGERGLLWDTRARGAFLGLQEVHTPADLARGVYEGVAFSLKEVLAAVGRLSAPANEVVSGTPLTHPGWAQMRADMYGLPLLFPAAPDLTGLGAALLALVSQGVFANTGEAVAKCCRIVQRVEPDPGRVAYYQEVFQTYQAAILACQPLFARLS